MAKGKLKWRYVLTIALAVIGYGVLFYLFFRKANLPNIISVSESANWLYILIALIFCVFMILSQGLFLRVIFEIFKVPISLKEAAITWLMTVPAGALTAGLSGPAIIFYKAKRKKAPNHIAALISASYFIFYLPPNIIYILLVGGSAIYQLPGYYKMLAAVVSILAISLSILMVTSTGRRLIFNLVARFFPKALPREEIDRLSSFSVLDVLKAIGASSLEVSMALCIFAASFIAFNAFRDVWLILRGFALAQLLVVFSPTGGGLGFVELGLAGGLKIGGIEIAQAVPIVLTFRAIEFWIPAILGWIFLSFKGFRFVREIRQ